MGKQAFTPGPWAIKQTYSDACYGASIQDGSGKSIVAISPSQKRAAIERKANAALIAAAPELYEALADCIAELDAYEAPVDPMDSHNVRVAKAKAALAKATGAA